MKNYKVVFFNKNNVVIENANFEVNDENELSELIGIFIKKNNLLNYSSIVKWEASIVVLTGSVEK